MQQPEIVFDIIRKDHEITDRLQAAKVFTQSEVVGEYHEQIFKATIVTERYNSDLGDISKLTHIPDHIFEILVNTFLQSLRDFMPCCLVFAHCREIRVNNTAFKNNHVKAHTDPTISKVLLKERFLPLHEIAESFINNHFKITFDADTGLNVNMTVV
ncbi:hypothetical protein HGH93_21670 [Chitinophaga polysaccharea]|uniref:hypothetical protein n=1 Tax=Chitinophaga polysaccharea TaxID=1293035 RepID=UPI001454FC09|nr:hypothetical protein [Chitinophaga polysaccharea]NLR60734.1 hypothetical protein [Chitinophaga polysaccharea]